MSSGKIHAAANITALALTALATPFVMPLPLCAGAIIGATLGTLCTPDVDLPGKTHEEVRLGFIGGGLYQLFWRGYTRTHSHRGSSHAPLTGTAGRWLYVFKRLWWLLAIIIYYQWPIFANYPGEWLAFIGMMFLFNAAQDVVHLILDGWKYHKGR